MAVDNRLRNRLSRGRGVAIGFTSLAMRVAGLAISFILGVVLARTLGPAQFGVYGLVIALSGLAMTIVSLGTPQLAVREFGVRHGAPSAFALPALSRSYLKATLLASTILVSAVMAIGTAVDPTTLGIVIPGALSVPFIAITAVVAGQLRGMGAISRGQVMDIFARPALALLAILALIASGLTIDSARALWVQVGVAAIAAAVSLVWLKRALPRAESGVPVAPWLASALPLCMVDLLRQLDGTYGSILLSWVASDVELGLYRAAISCSVVAAMPVTILHVIYSPEVARLIHEARREHLQPLLGQIALGASAMVGAITVGCLLLGRPLINLVFGSAYDGSWAPLSILCVAQLGFALFGMGPIMLAMGHREKALTKIYVIAIICAVAVAAALVRPYGAAGVAVGQLVSLGLIALLSWRDGRRNLDVDCSIFGLMRRQMGR